MSTISGMSKANPPKPIIVNGVCEYKVEDILTHRIQNDRLEYLVRWLGYDETEDTWEPVTALEHARDVLHSYQHHVHASHSNLLAAGAFPKKADLPMPQQRRLLAVHCMHFCGNNLKAASRLYRQLLGNDVVKYHPGDFLKKWAKTFRETGSLQSAYRTGPAPKVSDPEARKAAQIYKAGYRDKESGLILDYASVQHALATSRKLHNLQKSTGVTAQRLLMHMKRVCPSLRN